MNAYAPDWLRAYHPWAAALGELNRRAGKLGRAREHLERAIAKATCQAERELLKKRLAMGTS